MAGTILNLSHDIFSIVYGPEQHSEEYYNGTTYYYLKAKAYFYHANKIPSQRQSPYRPFPHQLIIAEAHWSWTNDLNDFFQIPIPPSVQLLLGRGGRRQLSVDPPPQTGYPVVASLWQPRQLDREAGQMQIRQQMERREPEREEKCHHALILRALNHPALAKRPDLIKIILSGVIDDCSLQKVLHFKACDIPLGGQPQLTREMSS